MAAVATAADPGLSMIITRTPLRITLGGGGTDLPSYYEPFGGMVISAAISKHIYISINRTFTADYFLKYSALERVDEPRPSSTRSSARRSSPTTSAPCVEIVSMADIPSGTGLGSSGAFTVGLLRAIYAMQRDHAQRRRRGRGGLPDRDRPARPAGRQAGPVRRGVRRAHDASPSTRTAASTVAPAGRLHRDRARPRGAPADVLHRLLPGRRRGARGAAHQVDRRATRP